MAREFDEVDDYITHNATNFGSDTVGTIMLWANIDEFDDDFMMASIDNDTNSSQDEIFFFYFRGDNDNRMQVVWRNTADDVSIRTNVNEITAVGWHTITLTSDATTIKYFTDAVESTLNIVSGSNNGQWFNTATTSDIFRTGALLRGGSGLSPYDGKIAHAVIWDVELSANEKGALFRGVNPFAIRHSSQKLHWALNGNDSPEGDYNAQTNQGTLTGTTKATTNPPVELLGNYL